MSLYSLAKVVSPGLALALCVLPIAAQSQASQAATAGPSPARSITLDPPSGLDLQADEVRSNGEMLPPEPSNFRRLGEAIVGKQADLHTLTLRFSQTTKITGVSVSKDFKIEQGGSCVEGNIYEKDATCRLLVRFTPHGPGYRLGELTVSRTGSDTPDAFGLGGYSYMPVASFIPSIITTVPGSYPSSKGLLSGAWNLTVDGGDRLYVADTGNNVVRYMDSSGTISIIASGLTAPVGIAVDNFGDAYFSETSMNAIIEKFSYAITPEKINGTGTDTCTFAAPCRLLNEALTEPGEMAMDQNNNLFFQNNAANSEAALSMNMQGDPTFANILYPYPEYVSFPLPYAVDAGENLYYYFDCKIISQTANDAENRNFTVTEIVGGTCGFSGDGGQAAGAKINNQVSQIAFDSGGNLYFSDTNNQRVRRVDRSTGIIRTIAGNGTSGYTGDGGQATSAELSSPTGVAVDSQGQVYIISSATSGQVIRQITATGFRGLGAVAKGTKGAPGIVTLTNTGNSSWQLTNHLFTGTNPTEFAVDNTTTSCILTAGAILSSGQTCQIGFTCTPAAKGERKANFVLLDNTANNSNTIELACNGILPSATFKITSPANNASFTSGTSVTFTVSVTSASGPAPTGTVQFKVDGTNYGSPWTVSSGSASTSVGGLSTGSHTLSATYSGDSNYAAGGPISVTIKVTTTTTTRQP